MQAHRLKYTLEYTSSFIISVVDKPVAFLIPIKVYNNTKSCSHGFFYACWEELLMHIFCIMILQKKNGQFHAEFPIKNNYMWKQ